MSNQAIAQGIPQDLHWAMVYHHGLPVATCPVAEVTAERLKLMCGPLCFERHAQLDVSLSRHTGGGPLEADWRLSGEVEVMQAHWLSIRIEAE